MDNDLLRRLPASAREKVAALRDEIAADGAVHHELSGRRAQAMRDLNERERVLATVIANSKQRISPISIAEHSEPYTERKPLRADSPAEDFERRLEFGAARPSAANAATAYYEREIADAERRVEEQRAEVARLSERWTADGQRYQELLALHGHITGYLDGLPSGAVLAEHRGAVAPRLPARSDVRQALDQARSRLPVLRADLHTIRSASLPTAELKAISRQRIEQLAERGEPNLAHFVDDGTSPFQLPMTRTAGIPGATPAGVVIPDAWALLAWLHRDALIAALDREIDALIDDAHAMPAATRIAKEREMLAAILQLEREEEWLVTELRGSGVRVARRPDADPRAVLGLGSELPSPRGILD